MLKLKEFEVVETREANLNRLAVLRCPRRDCGGEFEVERNLFGGPIPGGTHNPNIDTRPCPYCFRVSLRPKKVRKKK